MKDIPSRSKCLSYTLTFLYGFYFTAVVKRSADGSLSDRRCIAKKLSVNGGMIVNCYGVA